MNKRHGIRRPHGQQGLTLLELIGALSIMAIITAAAIPVANRYVEDNKGRVVADQVSKLVGPANAYINANYAAISATATATTPYVITPATLQAAGFLDPAMFLTNPYGQGYQIAVLQPTAGVLQGLIVTTGGAPISEREMPLIAAQVGGAGGFVSGQSALGANFAQGAYGGVKTQLTNFGGSPGTGHVAAALFYSNLATVDDSLHRHTTAGQPQYNQMSTNIDMGGNSVNNALNVNAQGVNIAQNTNSWTGVTVNSQQGGHQWLMASVGSGWGGQAGNLVFYDQSANVQRASIDTAGNFAINAGNYFKMGNASVYGDNTNAMVSAGASGGTVYIRGGGWNGANLDVWGNITSQNIYGSNIYGSGLFSTGWILAGYDSNGNPTNNGLLVTSGGGGWIDSTYGGGWMMQDSTWIRARNNKNVYTPGTMEAGVIQADTQVQLAANGNQGWGCSTSAITAKSDGSGNLMACIWGNWQQISGDSYNYYWKGQYVNQTVNGSNPTSHTMWVMTFSQGYNCGPNNNDYGAMGYVNGNLVATNVENNVNYYHSKSMSFAVPAGGSYSVVWSQYICNTQTTIWEYR